VDTVRLYTSLWGAKGNSRSGQSLQVIRNGEATWKLILAIYDRRPRQQPPSDIIGTYITELRLDCVL
jgi:hypothetical protein